MSEVVTVSDFKTYKGITDTTDDNLIGDLINRAEFIARAICNRYEYGFMAVDGSSYKSITEEFDGGADAVIARYIPVINGSVMVETRFNYANASYTTVSSDNYRVNNRTGEISLVGGFVFPDGPAAVRITYNGGYEFPSSEAADLVDAILSITDYLYSSVSTSDNIVSENLGNYSYSLGDQKEVDSIFRDRLFNHIRPEML